MDNEPYFKFAFLLFIFNEGLFFFSLKKGQNLSPDYSQRSEGNILPLVIAWFSLRQCTYILLASQVLLVVKNSPANAGDGRGMNSIPGSRKPPGDGHSNPLQYSCPENSMDRGTWQAMVQFFSSVTQLCPTLCNPMDYSMPGLPVQHQLPEFNQTHAQ